MVVFYWFIGWKARQQRLKLIVCVVFDNVKIYAFSKQTWGCNDNWGAIYTENDGIKILFIVPFFRLGHSSFAANLESLILGCTMTTLKPN